MSLCARELRLWGLERPLGDPSARLVLPAQDRRGEGGTRNRRRQVRGGGEGAQPPSSSTPTPRHPGSCPAPEPGPALGCLRVEGGRKRSHAEGQRKEMRQGMPPACFQLTSATGTAEAGWRRAGLRGAGEPTDLMSIKATLQSWVCLSSGHLGQRNGPFGTCALRAKFGVAPRRILEKPSTPKRVPGSSGRAGLWPTNRAWCSGGRGQRTEKARSGSGRMSEGKQVPNPDRNVGPGPTPPTTEATVELTLPGTPATLILQGRMGTALFPAGRDSRHPGMGLLYREVLTLALLPSGLGHSLSWGLSCVLSLASIHWIPRVPSSPSAATTASGYPMSPGGGRITMAKTPRSTSLGFACGDWMEDPGLPP